MLFINELNLYTATMFQRSEAEFFFHQLKISFSHVHLEENKPTQQGRKQKNWEKLQASSKFGFNGFSSNIKENFDLLRWTKKNR